MAKSKVKLSIIILSWNTRELLNQCLKSLELGPEVEVIVVDNGSTDGSAQAVKKEFPGVKLIINKENLGFSKGNNEGIKRAQGDYIMLLNSDTLIKKGAIEKLINFLDEHSEIGIVGPKLLNQDGSPQSNCGRFPNLLVALVMLFAEHWGADNFVRCSPAKSGLADWLMGAAFMARKEVFEKIGGLDEQLFMYMEEVEWFYRSRKAGFLTYFFKEAEIIHLGRGSAKHGKKDPIINIYRGLLYFYRKHKNFPELFILRLMLKTKAFLALIIGHLKNDNYLKETYGEALKIS
ncbi:MAG TPA: glycosyltransferase family 2 protein [Patescibacteria group bacterium]|nr:glycosyltransferase family 2 protein [Patescibacteria group bacterium]